MSMVLEGVRESLAYRFAVRCEEEEVAQRAAAMLADFAPLVAADESVGRNHAPTYSIERWPDRDGDQFALFLDGEPFAVNEDPGRVIDRLVRAVSSAALSSAPLDRLLVHAGAVATPEGRGVLLAGDSGSGKTTIVASLVQAGYGYLSDEAAVIDPETLLVTPWPRPLDFKPGAAALDRFGDLLGPYAGLTCHVRAERLRDGALGAPCPARVIFDYRYEPGHPIEPEPLSGAEAVVVLGRATPALRHHGARGLEALTRIVSGAYAYRLRTDSLDAAVRQVRMLAER